MHEARHSIYRKGRLGGQDKGERLPKVLTMVKTAPLGIASRR